MPLSQGGLFMRPIVKCNRCGRKARISRRVSTKLYYGHKCPGPWIFEDSEEDWNSPGSYRINLYNAEGYPTGKDTMPSIFCDDLSPLASPRPDWEWKSFAW